MTVRFTGLQAKFIVFGTDGQKTIKINRFFLNYPIKKPPFREV